MWRVGLPGTSDIVWRHLVITRWGGSHWPLEARGQGWLLNTLLHTAQTSTGNYPVQKVSSVGHEYDLGMEKTFPIRTQN